LVARANLALRLRNWGKALSIMSTASPDDLDAVILSVPHTQFQKVAMIIAKVLSGYKGKETSANYDAIADRIAERIQALVDAGKLESQGNLSKWRYSEVKLPD
jgi:hypothetical protein